MSFAFLSELSDSHPTDAISLFLYLEKAHEKPFLLKEAVGLRQYNYQSLDADFFRISASSMAKGSFIRPFRSSRFTPHSSKHTSIQAYKHISDSLHLSLRFFNTILEPRSPGKQQRPTGWNTAMTAFVLQLLDNHEQVRSVIILLETESPRMTDKLSLTWIEEVRRGSEMVQVGRSGRGMGSGSGQEGTKTRVVAVGSLL